MARRRRRGLPAITRVDVLFVVGLAGIINEEFFRSGAERSGVLMLLAGMVGLPALLRANEVTRRILDDEDEQDDEDRERGRTVDERPRRERGTGGRMLLLARSAS